MHTGRRSPIRNTSFVRCNAKIGLRITSPKQAASSSPTLLQVLRHGGPCRAARTFERLTRALGLAKTNTAVCFTSAVSRRQHVDVFSSVALGF